MRLNFNKIARRSFSTTKMENLKQKAYYYEQNGNPIDVLKFGEIEISSQKPNFEVLESPINPSDINMIEGKYPLGPTGKIKIAGNECVGYYTSNGTKRLAMPRHQGLGAWRKHLFVEKDDIILLPQYFNYIPRLSTLMVNPCTAYRLLSDFVDLKDGDVIVQNAANSVVGRCVIQLAKILKFKTVNIVRDREGIDEVIKDLTSIGGDVVITDKMAMGDSADVIKSMKPAALALNAVGGKTTIFMSRLLKENGVFVTYGGMSKQPITASTGSFIFKNLTYRGFWITKWYQTCSDHDRIEMIKKLYDYISHDEITFPIKKIDFEDKEQVMKAISEPAKNVKSVIVF